MERSEGARFEEVGWGDVKEAVARVNPAFAEIIEQLPQKNACPIYKVRYPFGSEIVTAGAFYFPLADGTLVPIVDERIPATIRKQLVYRGGSIPLSMVLNHSVELFSQAEDRAITIHYKKAGTLFGLQSALSSDDNWLLHIWHITAGARSLFVLPKMTDTQGYKRLCRARGIRAPLPRRLHSHWSLLTQLARHPDFSEPWYADVLFFSKAWLNNQDDIHWLRFHHFLYREMWEVAGYFRYKVIYDQIWDRLVRKMMKDDIKAIPFIIDIVKYVLLIKLGSVPGFCPAMDSEAAPVRGLQEDIVTLYGLKSYTPTIMVPRHFSLDDPRPVYWSLAMPTHFESMIKPKQLASTLTILRELRELMLSFRDTMLKSTESLQESVTTQLLKRVRFDFFHSEPDLEGHIRLSLEMPKEDPTLIHCQAKFGQRTFSDVSPFVRGCLRLMLE